jgi:hypothetical protein
MLVAVVHVSKEARILGFFLMSGKSQMAGNIALVKELACKGHEITVVSP